MENIVNIAIVLTLILALIILFLVGLPKCLGKFEGYMSEPALDGVITDYLKNKDYTRPTPLCEIMTAYGSDKGTNHNYSTLYYLLFAPVKYQRLSVLELGLGTNNANLPSNMGAHGKPGASLYGWAEFFPYASIYGADIDKDILFNTGRIQTFYCDQLNAKDIADLYAKIGTDLDIIIEDGLHTFEANYSFLVNSLDHLKKGGIYVVEDIKEPDKFRAILDELKERYNLAYIGLVEIPKENSGDNNLLIIQK